MPELISRYKHLIITLGLISLCFLLVYYQVVLQLAYSWDNNPNYSHGYFIPFVSAFMVWYKSQEIFGQTISPSPLPGMLLVLAGLAQLIVGWVGTVNFLQATSMIPVLTGLSLVFWGGAVTRRLLAPILFLIFMIPLPAIIWNQMAFPLALLASKIAAFSMDSIGLFILREGNILYLPDVTLQVEEACSGLRSLTTLFALSALIAYMSPLGRLSKLIVFLSAVPIAVVGNIVRLIATGVLAKYFGAMVAEGFIHDFSGWLLFFFGLVFLVFLQDWLSRWHARGRDQEKGAS